MEANIVKKEFVKNQAQIVKDLHVKAKVNTNLENKVERKKKGPKGGGKKPKIPYQVMEQERKSNIKSQEQLLVEAAENIYGIKIKQWKKIGGRGGNFNIELKTSKPQGKLFLKINSPDHTIQRLTQEVEILNFLKRTHNSVQYPGTKKSLKGNVIPWFEMNDKKYRFRLMDFIQGIQICYYARFSKELLYQAGLKIGEMSKCLENYPGKVTSPSLFNYDVTSMKHYAQIKKPCSLLDRLIDNYESKFLPVISKRPQAVIHGNLDLGKIKVNRAGEISGILEFGYSRMSHPGYDIGTLMASFSLRGYSFQQLSYLLKGFHEAYPFTPKELPLFYYFFCPRLMFMMRYFKPSGDTVRRIMVDKGQKSIERQLLNGLIFIENEENTIQEDKMAKHQLEKQTVISEQSDKKTNVDKNKHKQEKKKHSNDELVKAKQDVRTNEIKLNYKLSEYPESLDIDELDSEDLFDDDEQYEADLSI